VLGQLSGRRDAHLLGDGYAALADYSAPRLREVAAALVASAATQLDQDEEAPAWAAIADLNWAAFLIDANPSVSSQQVS